MDSLCDFARAFFGTVPSDSSLQTGNHVENQQSPISDEDTIEDEATLPASPETSSPVLFHELNKCIKTLADRETQIQTLRRHIRNLTDKLHAHEADLRQSTTEKEQLDAQLEALQIKLGIMEELYHNERSLRAKSQTDSEHNIHFRKGRIQELEAILADNEVRMSVLADRCKELEEYEKMVLAIRRCDDNKARRKRVRHESFESENADGDVGIVCGA